MNHIEDLDRQIAALVSDGMTGKNVTNALYYVLQKRAKLLLAPKRRKAAE